MGHSGLLVRCFMLVSGLTILVLLVLAPSVASAQVPDQAPPPVLAVMDITFDRVEMRPDAQSRMNDYLVSCMSGNGAFMVVARDDVARALSEQRVKFSSECYGSCRAKIGGYLAANSVLQAKMWKVGSTCVLTADLYDLASDTNVASHSVKDLNCDEVGLMKGIEIISARFGAGVSASVPVITGGGTVSHGLKLDRGESIVNAVTDETGIISIKTNPDGANIFINGKAVGKAPYQDVLMVGRYVITARLNALYYDAAREIVLTSNGGEVNLELLPAFGSLNITSTPSGAEVLIDGRPVGTTPYVERQMKSGTYQVEVRMDLYRGAAEPVTVSDGKSTTKAFQLAADFGGIEVASTPSGAAITIDGQNTGKVTPASFSRLASGLHVVTLDLEAYGRRVENVRVSAGSTERVSVQLEPKLGLLQVLTESHDGRPCDGTLLIDGRQVGQTPYKGNVLATTHRLEARCGNQSKTEEVAVEHNANVIRRIRMDNPTPDGFVLIPAGSFMMGSPNNESDRSSDEGPQTRVTISRPFLMKTTEVTQGEWKSVMGSNPSYFSKCGDNCPVEQVSWFDAVEYCNGLSSREGFEHCYEINGQNVRFKGLSCKGYRLPTEAEWEYAARAGSTGARYGDIDAIAWYDDNSGNTTHPGGRKSPNAWGLYDMLGNVWEWCWDWYTDKYAGGSVMDPTGSSLGSTRVIRGGSWVSFARRVRAANRNYFVPGSRYNVLGLRVVRSIP